MRISPALLTALLPLVPSALAYAVHSSHQDVLQPEHSHGVPFTFRDVVPEDLDDIATVFVDAFRPSSTWTYIHQFADKVDPMYTYTCQREAIRDQLFNPNTNLLAKVIAVPGRKPPSGTVTRERVVSFAVWLMDQTGRAHEPLSPASANSAFLSPLLWPNFGSPASSSGDSNGVTGEAAPAAAATMMMKYGNDGFNCSAQSDVNMTRALHYVNHMREIDRRYVRQPYPRQLYLGLLATHPEWDGNGFGATHLRWGKALAEGELGGMPVTLLSTAAGYPLYVSEGFEGLVNATIERLDGKGIIWHEGMKYEKASEEANEL